MGIFGLVYKVRIRIDRSVNDNCSIFHLVMVLYLRIRACIVDGWNYSCCYWICCVDGFLSLFRVSMVFYCIVGFHIYHVTSLRGVVKILGCSDVGDAWTPKLGCLRWYIYPVGWKGCSVLAEEMRFLIPVHPTCHYIRPNVGVTRNVFDVIIKSTWVEGPRMTLRTFWPAQWRFRSGLV